MTSIEILMEAKWFLVGLHIPTRNRLVEEIERLARDPAAAGARRLGGTRHVYRARCAGLKVLYHERDGRMTILVIRP